MYVYINMRRINIEINEIGNLLSCRNQTLISIHHRFMEIGMAHVATVHKEELAGTFLAGRIRTTNKAGHSDHCGIHLQRQEFLVDLLSENSHNALFQLDSRQVHHFRAIVMQGKRDFRIDQSNALELGQNIVQFRLVGLQELATGRDIEEKILYIEITALRTGNRFLTLYFRTGNT